MGHVGVNSANDISAAQQLAARLAAITDIRDIRLMKSSAEIVRLPAADPFLAYNLDSEASVEYEPGSESFVVHGKYRLAINSTSSSSAEDINGESGPDVARIEFEHAALFVMDLAISAPPQEEELNAYAVTMGQLALYPYVREYISDVTARLGLPPLTIGVLRIPYPSNKGE